jgi:hypothetical protein
VCAFCPLSRAWRSRQSTCSDFISGCRGQPGVAAPHTYCGSIATDVAMAENHGGLLCGLEIMLYPRTVPCKGVAEPMRLAR